jgi:hypothetical protein
LLNHSSIFFVIAAGYFTIKEKKENNTFKIKEEEISRRTKLPMLEVLNWYR